VYRLNYCLIKGENMSECVRLPVGCYLVVTNGTLDEVELEDPHLFTSKQEALDYIQDEQEQYPGLDYYLCPITELHHATVTKHVRNLI